MTSKKDLSELAIGLTTRSERLEEPDFYTALAKLEEAAKVIGRSWSGSWMGYQAQVYYTGFKTPPAGVHFSKEWGISDSWPNEGTRGDWTEYTFEEVMDTIRKQTENSDVEFQEKESKKTAEYFEEARSNALSFLSNEIVLRPSRDPIKWMRELSL